MKSLLLAYINGFSLGPLDDPCYMIPAMSPGGDNTWALKARKSVQDIPSSFKDFRRPDVPRKYITKSLYEQVWKSPLGLFFPLKQWLATIYILFFFQEKISCQFMFSFMICPWINVSTVSPVKDLFTIKNTSSVLFCFTLFWFVTAERLWSQNTCKYKE